MSRCIGRIRSYVVLAGSVLALLLLVLPGHASTLRVPTDYPTIQAAIDAAAHGDTVEVECGTYYEHDIDMKSGVCLRSESGEPECVTIDAMQLGRVIYCSWADSSTVFEGLTFTGGSRPQTSGGGVQCRSQSTARFVRCDFIGNSTGRHGGGLSCYYESTPVLEKCRFIGNSASHWGGGVSCTWDSAPTFRDCWFSENTAADGGGLCCSSPGASPVLVDCVITGNFADSGGGVQCRAGASPTLTRCVLSDNTAVHGGALRTIYGTYCSPRLSDVICSGNSASLEGGGLMAAYGTPVYERVTVVGNTAPTGGGIFIGHEGTAALNNVIVAFNSTGFHLHEQGAATLVCCDLFGNDGGDWVGGIANQLGVAGNICEDPLFCGEDEPSDPLSLHSTSPCAPENSGACGLIGARGVGCGESTIESTSWGSIKARFR